MAQQGKKRKLCLLDSESESNKEPSDLPKKHLDRVSASQKVIPLDLLEIR